MTDPVRAIHAATALVPLPRPLVLGDARIAEREYAAVRVESESGAVGRAYCLTREAPMSAIVERMIAPAVVGRDATDPAGAWEAAFRASALAEIAAWDAPPLGWLEDPLLPEDAEACARIRAGAGQPIAVGDEVTDPRTNAALLAAPPAAPGLGFDLDWERFKPG